MELLVHRIIPFSNVDGEGNRCAIFLQGCNLNCVYCHNKETIPKESEDAYFLQIDELVKQIKGYMPFIRGITVSGGEPMLQRRGVLELFKKVKQLGLSCYIDTNGCFNLEKNDVYGLNNTETQELIETTDKFLYDIKGDIATNNIRCFDNMSYLLLLNKIEEVRLVYMKELFDEKMIINQIAVTMKNYPTIPLRIIRMHTTGFTKERIIELAKYRPSKKDVLTLRDFAVSKGIVNIKYTL